MAGSVSQAAIGAAAARAGGRLLGLKLVVVIVAAIFLGSLIVGPIIAFGGIPHTGPGGSGVDPACSSGSANVMAAGAHAPIAGFAGPQLAAAAAIINAGNAAGVSAYGVNIAVMTAIGESGLQILNHGDAAGPDSRGLFQQRDSWGSLSDRMDPTKSATMFYEHLLQVGGWQSMTPTQAAHAVQGNADPNYYQQYWTAAQSVVAGLTAGSGGGCQLVIAGNPAQLAQQIMTLTSQGKIKWLEADYEQQVQAYATGTSVSASCYLDPRLLQVIIAVATKEAPIGISDLNRRCTGQTPGAGVYSYHWKGKAVDFYMLRGSDTTGRDGAADTTIQFLDQITNTRGAVGQSECGSLDGYQLKNLYTFQDTCNHLHYQLGPGTDPLHLGTQAAAASATIEGTTP